MIASLTVRSARLLTKNPKKVTELDANGIRVSGRIPHVTPPNEHRGHAPARSSSSRRMRFSWSASGNGARVRRLS